MDAAIIWPKAVLSVTLKRIRALSRDDSLRAHQINMSLCSSEAALMADDMVPVFELAGFCAAEALLNLSAKDETALKAR